MITFPPQCQYFSYDTYMSLSNGSALPSIVTYYNITGTVIVNTPANSDVGNYNIIIYYKNWVTGWYVSSTFWIIIVPNHAPYLNPGFNKTNSMYADHTWNYVYSMDYDIEDDTPFFEVLIYYTNNMTLLNP